MTIRRSFDHRAELDREAPTRDSFNDVVVTWQSQSVPTGKNCRPDQAWAGVMQDSGPGERQTSRQRWFLDRGFEPRERDVLRVTAGNLSGLRLRIVSVTPQNAGPRLHHHEVNVEVVAP
jgi:hypothetical protein